VTYVPTEQRIIAAARSRMQREGGDDHDLAKVKIHAEYADGRWYMSVANLPARRRGRWCSVSDPTMTGAIVKLSLEAGA
jgi:hypothetical protein